MDEFVSTHCKLDKPLLNHVINPPDGLKTQLLLYTGREEALDVGAVGGRITDHKHQGAVTTAAVLSVTHKSKQCSLQLHSLLNNGHVLWEGKNPGIIYTMKMSYICIHLPQLTS